MRVLSECELSLVSGGNPVRDPDYRPGHESRYYTHDLNTYYAPPPVALAQAQGASVEDVDSHYIGISFDAIFGTVGVSGSIGLAQTNLTEWSVIYSHGLDIDPFDEIDHNAVGTLLGADIHYGWANSDSFTGSTNLTTVDAAVASLTVGSDGMLGVFDTYNVGTNDVTSASVGIGPGFGFGTIQVESGQIDISPVVNSILGPTGVGMLNAVNHTIGLVESWGVSFGGAGAPSDDDLEDIVVH